MSDPKRATPIPVSDPKSVKKNVTKTLRFNINLDESNERKYPELNYKELVEAAERKKKVENGKTVGLDPYSDNDDDVERVARKFEQKYGGKNTYGRKARSKHDDFADIGAGYDENDSFIDNTDGYDEMIPPECDTFYGGFYINSGSLEFKTVPESQVPVSDSEPSSRRNKRRISSSSSEEESSESSSESSQDVKEPKAVPNGTVDSHKTEHRKKKIKNSEKKKPKRIRRTDSSAATSGKQTSDDPGEGESADSRTSQSDSMTSKPAPSSENAATSDSSRDVGEPDSVLEAGLSQAPAARAVLDEMKCHIARLQLATPSLSTRDVNSAAEPYLLRLEKALQSTSTSTQKSAWTVVARILSTTRAKLAQKVKQLQGNTAVTTAVSAATSTTNATTTTSTVSSTPAGHGLTAPWASSNPASKRKRVDDESEIDYDSMNSLEKEFLMVKTLRELEALIEDKKPAMIASYNYECSRVQEERKKLQIARADGAPAPEKRLPKRRFPWCQRSRVLVQRVAKLAGDRAEIVLGARALPLFPKGFVRMPTLLRQAVVKLNDVKRQRLPSTSQPATQNSAQPQNTTPTFPEPIQFPSSLTVTTTIKTAADRPEDLEIKEAKMKPNNVASNKTPTSSIESSSFTTTVNSFSKDLIVEKQEDRLKVKEPEKAKSEDLYVPPNSIGSITITPVNNTHKTEKPVKALSDSVAIFEKQKEALIRVKSPAALIREADEIAKKEKDRHKNKVDKSTSQNQKEKNVNTPLIIETNFQPKEKPKPSPNLKKDEVTQKQLENMRTAEDKIPRPALIPVQHSPTFAKPDKRPPDAKKKKDIVIVSDVDPLGDVASETLAIDDSSSDVEVIEEKNCEKSDNKSKPVNCSKQKSVVIKNVSDLVPSKEKLNVNSKKEDNAPKERSSKAPEKRGEDMEVDNTAEFDIILRSLKEMQDSQEPSFNSNPFGGVNSELNSLNKTDGCNSEVNIT